jgi:hypothetical protein
MMLLATRSVVLVALMLTVVTAACAQAPPPLTIEQAVTRFLERNLGVEAARFRVDIARAERIAARARPNPTLTLAAESLKLDGPTPAGELYEVGRRTASRSSSATSGARRGGAQGGGAPAAAGTARRGAHRQPRRATERARTRAQHGRHLAVCRSAARRREQHGAPGHRDPTSDPRSQRGSDCARGSTSWRCSRYTSSDAPA